MIFRADLSRRQILQFASTLLPVGACGLAVAPPSADIASGSGGMVSDTFPAHAHEIVRETVTVAHFDMTQLQKLVEARPSLANAAWDWGFGDWESALGAASHMGNRAIADYLISRGARPSVFSAAMFGQLAVVKAFVEAQPGLQRIRGPHGISLLAHARMGGAGAHAVLEYLQSLADADAAPTADLAEADLKALLGTYIFGIGASQQVDITADPQMYGTKMYPVTPPLTWTRKGTIGRPLFHLGEHIFYPGGAPHVRIRFAAEAGAVIMTVTDAETTLTALKKTSG